MSNPPPDMFPGGALRQCPFASGRLPAPPRPSACRGRLGIGYQITGEQLRCTVEVACHTETVQVLTTLGWACGLDGFSRRVLTDALRAAAHPDNTARLHVFAAAARELFRHTSKTLAPDPRGGVRRRRAACPACDRLSHPFIAEAGALHGDLLAAIDKLRNDARLRPHVTITDRAAASRFLSEVLSALQGLYALFGSYLEHALQPLEPLVTRAAVRAFILETRRELDDLATCYTIGDVHAETLTITEPGDNAISLEVEGSLGGCGGVCPGPDVPHGAVP